MADKNKTEETKTEEKRVSVTLPRGMDRDEPMQFVSVNGENFWLPKGDTSEVPPAIAKEIERSQKAEKERDKHRRAMLEKAK